MRSEAAAMRSGSDEAPVLQALREIADVIAALLAMAEIQGLWRVLDTAVSQHNVRPLAFGRERMLVVGG